MAGNVKVEKIGRARLGLLAMITALTLAGCGGGSGGGSSTGAIPPHTPPPAPQNKPPVIGGAPATTLKAGDAYTFQPTASDPDGDSLTFSATGLPSWLAVNTSTGQLRGTAPGGSAGTYGGIVITVTDGKASASLPAFSITVTALPVSGKAELSWTTPTQNEDGSALTNLAGYKVRYGQTLGALGNVLDVPSPGTTTVVIEELGAGTWYFTVASYTNSGVESAPTGAVSKTIS